MRRAMRYSSSFNLQDGGMNIPDHADNHDPEVGNLELINQAAASNRPLSRSSLWKQSATESSFSSTIFEIFNSQMTTL